MAVSPRSQVHKYAQAVIGETSQSHELPAFSSDPDLWQPSNPGIVISEFLAVVNLTLYELSLSVLWVLVIANKNLCVGGEPDNGLRARVWM